MSTSALIGADFRTAPYLHQLHEFEISADLECRALLWQQRTGKTKLVIDTACHLYLENKIDAVIVLAPNGVHENWVRRELPVHMWTEVPHLSQYWRTFDAKQPEYHTKFDALLRSTSLLWFTYASETVIRLDARALIAQIIQSGKRVMLVVDESDDYGSCGAKKTKMVRALALRCPYRRILTGTVTENSPLRAFSQYEILAPGALGHSTFQSFKQRYACYKWVSDRQVGGRKSPGFAKLLEYQYLAELKERMAPWSSVVLRGQCEDLPNLVKRTRNVEMTARQQQAYSDLVYEYTTQLADGGTEVSIGENTNRLIKLQQIGSGFLIDEFREVHLIPGGNPRLVALIDEVLLTQGKNIIWCAFRRDIDVVTTALRAEGRRVLGYHGRSTSEEKAQARVAFAPGAEDTYDDLVGHPRSGGRGLNLSGADKIIWYSHTFDAMLKSQADERATLVGGDNVQVISLVGTPTDEYILETVSRKTGVAEDLARQGMLEVLKRLKM